MREVLDKKKKLDIKNKHSIELEKLEEDFSKEIKNFTDHWNERIDNYKKECQKMEHDLLQQNKSNLEEYRSYLEENIPEKGKDSAKLIEMKNKIDHLVKNQEYKDAHYLQQKAFELENNELEKYTMERNKKMDNLLEQKLTLHQNEYNSLKQRILCGLDELELQRNNEYERLFLKYNNLKKNIETNQTMQSQILEKSIKLGNIQNLNNKYFSLGEDKKEKINNED